jgi:hypothetical protein
MGAACFWGSLLALDVSGRVGFTRYVVEDFLLKNIFFFFFCEFIFSLYAY